MISSRFAHDDRRAVPAHGGHGTGVLTRMGRREEGPRTQVAVGSAFGQAAATRVQLGATGRPVTPALLCGAGWHLVVPGDRHNGRHRSHGQQGHGRQGRTVGVDERLAAQRLPGQDRQHARVRPGPHQDQA
ncbi:hypothetical protein ACFVVX_07130 [Kitasatospora sp. NPDC058170]|uniref:hypothetical protein n=1 Tax=Kitasatospora sp. NPDC058170 TaxID=3346364 RepID=UPI0036DBA24C